jgi:hypothetical protein
MSQTYTINANGLSWPGEPGQRDTAPPRGEVDLCRAFLARCERTKTGRYNSYSLKHVIERAVSDYVSNGACIQAAVELGIRADPAFHGYGLFGAFRTRHPPNAWIGVSKRSVRRVASCGWGDPQAGGAGEAHGIGKESIHQGGENMAPDKFIESLPAGELGLIHRKEKQKCR